MQQDFQVIRNFGEAIRVLLQLITYYMQKRHVFGDMSVEIYNSDGELVKTLPAGKNKGINYVEWAVRKKPPRVKASHQCLHSEQLLVQHFLPVNTL